MLVEPSFLGGELSFRGGDRCFEGLPGDLFFPGDRDLFCRGGEDLFCRGGEDLFRRGDDRFLGDRDRFCGDLERFRGDRDSFFGDLDRFCGDLFLGDLFLGDLRDRDGDDCFLAGDFFLSRGLGEERFLSSAGLVDLFFGRFSFTSLSNDDFVSLLPDSVLTHLP